jgi:hypothetical protein
MKRFLLIMVTAVMAFYSNANAQCPFVPTVYPDNLILCPETTDTLWTQQYDSYQWFKEDSIIPGATQRFLVVDQYLDAGYSFKVAATLNGCTDTSELVLVDGWVFAGMFVIHEGDQGWTDQDGTTHLCEDDTLILHLFEFPYDTNIVWYKDGTPIPGENTNYLNITESGSYTASGSPSLCPNWTAHLGVSIGVEIHTPIKPVISLNGNILESSKAEQYQWFFNGDSIVGANNRTFAPPVSGMYAVQTVDSNECVSLSDPYNFVISGLDHKDRNALTIFPNPSSGKVYITLAEKSTRSNAKLNIFDYTGRLILNKEVILSDRIELDLQDLTKGIYQVILNDNDKVLSGVIVIK